MGHCISAEYPICADTQRSATVHSIPNSLDSNLGTVHSEAPLFQLRHNHCPLLFVLLSAERGLFLKFFIPFLNTKTNIVNNMNINGKSLGAVLEIRTEVRRMVSIDKFTEL